jgi:hypothetical protein
MSLNKTETMACGETLRGPRSSFQYIVDSHRKYCLKCQQIANKKAGRPEGHYISPFSDDVPLASASDSGIVTRSDDSSAMPAPGSSDS